MYIDDNFTGGRYTVVSGGLYIRNVTEEDNGDYICRGLVAADGRLDETHISVQVQREFHHQVV